MNGANTSNPMMIINNVLSLEVSPKIPLFAGFERTGVETGVCVVWSVMGLFLHHALATHEATGAGQQDNDCDKVDDDLVDAGQDVDDHGHRCKALKDAKQEARSDSAGKGSHTAYNYHDERQNQEIEAHVVVWGNDGRVHHTPQDQPPKRPNRTSR